MRPFDATMEGLRRANFTCVPQAIIGRDHTLLDGLCVRREAYAAAPGLLVCMPNGNHFEDLAPWLADLSDATRRPVYAYNYRGVGRSVGKLHATNHAVADVKDAIRRVAASSSPASGRGIGVMGISIGGACSAVAIDQLKHEFGSGAADIGQFASVHSFRSLPATVAAMLGPVGGWLFLGLSGVTWQNTLNAVAAARRGPLAQTMAVVHAETDGVVRPAAAMTLPPQSSTSAKLLRFDDVGEFHCDVEPLLTARHSWLHCGPRPLEPAPKDAV